MPQSLFDQVAPQSRTGEPRVNSSQEVARRSVERIEKVLDRVFEAAKVISR